MRWSLNTSEPCTVDALAANLGAEVAAWKAQRRREFAQNILDRVEPQEAGDIDARVLDQMAGFIDAAIVAAKAMRGQRFNVSLYGLVDHDPADGIEDRANINVDMAP